jgi:hypothetical protein
MAMDEDDRMSTMSPRRCDPTIVLTTYQYPPPLHRAQASLLQRPQRIPFPRAHARRPAGTTSC